MDLIWLVLIIAAIGFIVWLITHHITMDPLFKVLIYVVVGIFMVLWLLRQFGQTIPNVMR